MASQGKKSENSTTVKLYLILYNLLQVFGWSYLLYQIVTHFLEGGKTSNLYQRTQETVFLIQNAAVLEVTNVFFGFVKSDLVTTFLQILSRVLVVSMVLLLSESAQQCFGMLPMLLAWSITEIVRYSFYTLGLIAKVPYFLTWCRYTFFYFLYPIGITGELICYYYAQKALGEATSNKLTPDYSSTFQYILILAMLVYIPASPKMYFHMISQRRKIIEGKVPVTKKVS